MLHNVESIWMAAVEAVATSKFVLTMGANGALATFGAAANYLYNSAKTKTPFQFGPFFVTAFLGFFIGNVVGGFIPADFPYRDGTLLVAGFCCYPLLAILETQFPKIFLRKVEDSLGVKPESTASKKDDADDTIIVIKRRD